MTDIELPEEEERICAYLESLGYQVERTPHASSLHDWWKVTDPDGTVLNEDEVYRIYARGHYREAKEEEASSSVLEWRKRKQ